MDCRFVNLLLITVKELDSFAMSDFVMMVDSFILVKSFYGMIYLGSLMKVSLFDSFNCSEIVVSADLFIEDEIYCVVIQLSFPIYLRWRFVSRLMKCLDYWLIQVSLGLYAFMIHFWLVEFYWNMIQLTDLWINAFTRFIRLGWSIILFDLIWY